MHDANFWVRLYALADQLEPPNGREFDVGLDSILDDLRGCEEPMRRDMRETLDRVISKLAILQVRLPPAA